jgi:hypothetical protein
MSEKNALIGGVVAAEPVEALVGRTIPQPVLDPVWTQEEAQRRKQARLTVYLGAAPGVGKTYAMLGEGQRAKARGTDVVVGIAQTYGRPHTIECSRASRSSHPASSPTRAGPSRSWMPKR